MKKLKFILLLTVLLTTFSCQSGKQKVQSKEEKSINEFVAHLTEVDTVLITNLINLTMKLKPHSEQILIQENYFLQKVKVQQNTGIKYKSQQECMLNSSNQVSPSTWILLL